MIEIHLYIYILYLYNIYEFTDTDIYEDGDHGIFNNLINEIVKKEKKTKHDKN